jgi:iron(III) transport system substrate-binding protein
MLPPIPKRNTTKAFPWFWAIVMAFFLAHSPCYAASEPKAPAQKAPEQKTATQNPPATQAPAAQTADASFVNVYTTEDAPLWQELFKAFGEKTGIRVRYSVQDGADILKKLAEDADIPKADAVILRGLPLLWQAGDGGFLQAAPSLILDSSVPDALQGGPWIAFAQQASVMIYDKTKNKIPPSGVSSYEALASPVYKNGLCLSMAPLNQSLVASLIKAHGETKTAAWIKGILNNTARPPSGEDGDQIADVLAGRCALAVVGDDTVRRLPMDQQTKIGVIYPNAADRGTHITITGAGVIRNAAHREEAIKFMEFLVSRMVQDRLANDNKDYRAVNVRKTADQKSVDPFGFHADPVAQKDLGPYTAPARDVMGKAGW